MSFSTILEIGTSRIILSLQLNRSTSQKQEKGESILSIIITWNFGESAS